MIIALVQMKGGVGKSTLAVCIASELQARGRRVLLVDADPVNLTACTWHDIATENGYEAPTVVAVTGATMHQAHQLPLLAKSYDDVVIDTPARMGAVGRSALGVADVGLLPCGAEGPDSWALAGTLEAVAEVQAVRAVKVAVVLNRQRQGTRLAAGARAEVTKGGLPVLQTEIGMRTAYGQALARGTGVLMMQPWEPAHIEMSALVDEVIAFTKGETYGSPAEAKATPDA